MYIDIVIIIGKQDFKLMKFYITYLLFTEAPNKEKYKFTYIA